MTKLSFIKLDIEIMNDSKIKMIRKMPDGAKLFELWIEYLEYYDITFQELSRKSGLELSFPKWLEENDKEIRNTHGDDFY